MSALDDAAAAAFGPLLDRMVATGGRSPHGMPGLVLGVAELGGAASVVARGTDTSGRPVVADSLHPIASASKLATGLVILRMVEDGAFALDTPLGDVLPEARAAAPGVTIGRLLSHTSGLPLDLPPGAVDFALGPDWPEMARAALRVAPAHAPGERVQYSNVAYYLLGLAAERVTGQPFRERLHATVFGPLGIEAYFREPLPDRVMTVGDADSDWVGTPREPYNSNFFRTWGLPASSVVTNAAGLLRLVQAYAGQGGVIRPDTAALARSDVAGEIPGGYATTDAFVGFRGSRAITWPSCAWGLGVEVQGGKVPHWAPASAPRSFGQIGSSGCLAWCDPDAGAAWCVLGTRTTDSGWLVRYGAGIARAALTAVREASRAADAPGRGARATVQIG